MTGLAIGSIKARDEISEVVVIAFRTRLLDTFVVVFFQGEGGGVNKGGN